jgi:hypothetical protein
VAKKTETETILPGKEGFLFGCDPELFVFNQDGVPVCADMIPGNKRHPKKVPGGAIQRDGMAAEFNIDPVNNFEDFDKNIVLVMGALEACLPDGYTLKAVPAVTFSEQAFADAPRDATELGCSPDYNAWTGGVNPPPYCGDNPLLRTASGHLHVGWTEGQETTDLQHVMNCCDLVKQFDWYLGGWSVKEDPDPARRLLYGKAGACRFKPYGVEYRVLSNFWVTSRESRLAVWNRMQAAITDLRNNNLAERYSNYNRSLTDMIDNSIRDGFMESNFAYPLKSIVQEPAYDPFGKTNKARGKSIQAFATSF